MINIQNKIRTMIYFIFVVLMIWSVSGCEKKTDTLEVLPDVEQEVEVDTAEEVMIVVHICGAINQPGVYTVPEGSRLYEVIAQAGGLKEEAVTESVNQARILSDGEQIYIPTVEESNSLTGDSNVSQGKVNLNTASKEELMTLTGIGESKAESIISYREEHGRFQSIEELMQIRGIKEGVYLKIQDKITV